MGVGNIIVFRPVLFVCGILFGTACHSDIDAGSIEVFDHVSRNVLKATSSHGDRIDHCNKLESSNNPPEFDPKDLALLKASRDDVLAAVAFLKFNNDFLCQRQTRLELAFYLGTMAALKRELNADPSSVEDLQSAISYPSSRELQYEVNYLKISVPKRRYFESVTGDKPFDLLKALDVNNLTRD